MKLRKMIIGIVTVAMVLPTFSSFDYNNYIKNTINAETEIINEIDNEKYQELANEVLRLLNEYRISQGIEPVKTNPLMMEMAQVRAKEQETTGLSHYRPNNTTFYTIFSEYDVKYSSVGENVAMGYPTPEATMNSWKNSEGHNKNMLDSNFTHVGIGVTYYNGSYYWTQLFAGTNDDKITSNDYLDTDRIVTTSNTNTSNISIDETVLGDVNNDNQVKSNDLLLLKKYLLGLEDLSMQGIKNADLNQDNDIKSNDLLQLKKILLGLE